MITIRLPNGREVDVQTDDPQAAARAAQNIFRAEHPDEFTTWNANRPLGGFFQNFGQAARGSLGSVAEGAGAVAGELGLPGEQTLRGAGESISGEAPTDRRGFEGASDLFEQFRNRPGETARAALGQGLGSLAGSVAAPAIIAGGAALAGAGAPVIGGLGLAAAIASGALQSTSELEDILKNEGISAERARELAVQVGPLIGAAEGGAAGVLLSRVLGRQVRRETAERLAQIAARGRLSAAGREAGVGAALEGGSEALAGAARQGVAAAETGNTNLAERADQVALDAILGTVGGGTVGGVAGSRQPGQARAALGATETPTETPDSTTAPPEDFGPTAPALPAEPEPVADVASAREVLAANPQIVVPPDTDDVGIIAAANLANRAAYRDEVASIRDNEVARFTGLNQVLIRPGEPDADGNVQDEADYGRAAPTLIRNVLTAMGNGAIEGDRFTTRQVLGLAVENLGLEASSVPASTRTQVTQYLNGLVSSGYLTKSGKDSFALAPRVRRPSQQSPTATDTTTSGAQAQAALPLLQAYQTNPTASNRRALQQSVAGTPMEPQIAEYLGLLQQRNEFLVERAEIAGRPSVDEQTAQDLQDIEADIASTATSMARIVDSLEGRSAGTAIAMPNEAPEFSAQTPRSQPEVDPDEEAFNQEFAREMSGSTESLTAPLRANPNEQIDEAQIARTIIERPAEAEAFVRNLTAGLPAGRPFFAANIRDAARSNGIQISDQTAIQLYNVARQTGIVTRTGTIARAQETRPANFAAANTFSPQTQLDADVARQAGEETFRRVLGQNGRLQIQDRIFLEELGDVVRKAAEEAGVKEADGVALGDLAILALRDRTTPITEVAIHEGWHVAENLGLFMPNELAILNANLDKIRAVIQRYIPNIAAQDLANPAEVRAYGLNARVFQNADFGSLINSIFDKFVNFIERIGNFVRGRGFQSWRDVYDVFNAGEMANRRPAEATTNTNFVGRPGQTQTEEFKKWFGGSKIVDENGEPLVVYRGMNGAEFLNSAQAETLTPRQGYAGFYTPNPALASSYANPDIDSNWSGDQGAVFPVYIKADKLIEFPTRRDSLGYKTFDKFEFDRQAKRLGPNEALVVRGISDVGPRGFMAADPQRLATYSSDVYAIGKGTQVKSAVGNRGTWDGDNEYINFSAAGTLMGRAGDRARIEQATKDELSWPIRIFGSPIMTIGKVLPNQRAAADTQKALYTRSNEMLEDTQPMIESIHQLPPASVARVTRVWEAASRSGKAPDMSGLNRAEQDALRQHMAATQRALDYFIESATIDSFLPTADKPAPVRAKLEAFWARNKDKHLWEIPNRELIAASPEGYREMQRLERLRNPSYMPMVSRGSHFIAAYKRKPNGERGEIVGLVAYEPRNFIQRRLKRQDPEAAAIAQLRAEFADPRKFVVMTEGRQFTNDANAQNVRNSADFVGQYMEKLREAASAGGNKKLLTTIRDMTAQMDKATMDRIFRPNNNILRAVTPQNEQTYLKDIMPQYLLSLGKIQARRYTQEPYKNATKNLSPNDKAYWDEARNYATSPSEAFGNLRAFAFFNYLGFALDTAAINLTQNLHSHAMLARDGGVQGSKIFAQVAGRMGFNNKSMGAKLLDPNGFIKSYMDKHAGPAEKAAMTKAMNQGVFAPVYTNESRSQFTVEGLRRAGFKNPQQAHKFLSRLTYYAGMPMQVVEAYNRATVFTAAYKLAEANPQVIARANQVDNTNYQSAYDYAVGKVIDTQFLTTKEDRAYFQRFTPAAEMATQFLSFPFKALEQYVRAGAQAIKGMRTGDPTLAKMGALNLLLMAGPLVMLGGLFALPMADFTKELLEDLIKGVWDSPQNFEMELREALGSGRLAEYAVGGAVQANGIMSLRRRISIDPVPYRDLGDLTAATLFGPVGSLTEIPQNFAQYYKNGDYWQMAASILPRAFGNVIRGAQIAVDEEQYTRRGNRVITPEIVAEANTGIVPNTAALRQAFGFPPPEFSTERDIVSMAEDISRATRSRSERYSLELSRVLVGMMEDQRDGRMDSATERMRAYGARLQEILQAEAERPAHLRVTITPSAIVRRAYRDFHGIGSEEALQQTGRRNAREEILRQRQILDWRSQPN